MSDNAGKRRAEEMRRVEELWKRQQTRKKRDASKENASKKSNATSQQPPTRRPRYAATETELPGYMLPTIATISRQASTVKSTAKQNPSRKKRAPLKPAKQSQRNKAANRRTAKRRQARSENALPAPSKSSQIKRKQNSETPSLPNRSKKRRIGRSPSVGKENVAVGLTEDGAVKVGLTEDGAVKVGLTEDGAAKAGLTENGAVKAGLTQDGAAEAGLTEDGAVKAGLTQDVSSSTSYGHSKRISFAPEDAEFTFKMSPAYIRFATPSRATPLMAIIEDNSSAGDDQGDDQDVNRTFAGRTPAPEKSRSLSTRISTPAGGASSTPAVDGIPSSPGSCKYSVIHSARQRVLSEKLSTAQGAEGKLAVLSQSPMVELKRRKSKRLSVAKPCLQLPPEGGEANTIEHFRKLVLTNTNLLESLASKWDEVNEGLTDVDEDVHGEIRSTACQARLIIAERFKQFGGLIDDSENNTGLKPVLVDDLQGFWDMIYYQVENVLAKFDTLEKRKANGWQVEEARVEKKVKKIKKTKKTIKAVSKFSAFRANMKKQQPDKEETASDVQLVNRDASVKKTPTARKYETADDVKTYSFRRQTMEHCFTSRSKPRRSTRKSLLPNVTPRSVQRSALVSPQNAASPELKKARCSPDLSPCLTKSAVRRRSWCSPSATMVNAMLSASKSGRVTLPNSPLLSTCKKEGTGNNDGFPNLVSSRKRRRSASNSLYRHVLANFTPATALTKLNLNSESPDAHTSNKSLIEEGQDLMTFDSLPTTPQPSDSLPARTPRRSARLATKTQARVSLL